MLALDIKKFLEGDADVTTSAKGGIWPSRVPIGVEGRSIVLQAISSERNYSLTNEVGQADMTLQVDCYAETPRAAEGLFQLVRNRLSGYRGTAGDGFIQGTRIIRESEIEEQPQDNSDQWVHRYSADFAMFYGQTVPTHA